MDHRPATAIHHFSLISPIFHRELMAGNAARPRLLQNARFRTPERFMIKARILLMVVPLITYATMSMICSGGPCRAGLETL